MVKQHTGNNYTMQQAVTAVQTSMFSFACYKNCRVCMHATFYIKESHSAVFIPLSSLGHRILHYLLQYNPDCS